MKKPLSPQRLQHFLKVIIEVDTTLANISSQLKMVNPFVDRTNQANEFLRILDSLGAHWHKWLKMEKIELLVSSTINSGLQNCFLKKERICKLLFNRSL